MCIGVNDVPVRLDQIGFLYLHLSCDKRHTHTHTEYFWLSNGNLDICTKKHMPCRYSGYVRTVL
jgi:hypothetical protein